MPSGMPHRQGNRKGPLPPGRWSSSCQFAASDECELMQNLGSWRNYDRIARQYLKVALRSDQWHDLHTSLKDIVPNLCCTFRIVGLSNSASESREIYN